MSFVLVSVRMIAFDGTERVGGGIVICMKILSQHSPGRTEETHDKTG
jgi:hypothetical protein